MPTGRRGVVAAASAPDEAAAYSAPDPCVPSRRRGPRLPAHLRIAIAALLLLPAFLAVGAALGAGYGAWLGNASYAAGPLRGATFALLPLAGSLLVVLPSVGAGPAGAALGVGPIPALGETVRHLAFGLVLGTLYPALARPAAGARADRGRATPGAEPSVAPSPA